MPAASASRVRRLPLLLLGAIGLMAPGFVLGQAGCSSDTNIEFRNDPGGVVTLNQATVRNITGIRNGSDAESREIDLNTDARIGRSTGVQGELMASGLDTSEFPDSGVKSNGFNRTINRFWTTTYNRGEYRFRNRNRLDVNVTFTVNGNEATNGNSSVSLLPRQRNIVATWYPGTNDLFRLEGDVRFRYRDLQNLSATGNHTTTLDVCVEVSGYE